MCVCVFYLAVGTAGIIDGWSGLCDGPAHWRAAGAAVILWSAHPRRGRKRTEETRRPRAWMRTTNAATRAKERVDMSRNQTSRRAADGRHIRGLLSFRMAGPSLSLRPFKLICCCGRRCDKGKGYNTPR